MEDEVLYTGSRDNVAFDIPELKERVDADVIATVQQEEANATIDSPRKLMSVLDAYLETDVDALETVVDASLETDVDIDALETVMGEEHQVISMENLKQYKDCKFACKLCERWNYDGKYLKQHKYYLHINVDDQDCLQVTEAHDNKAEIEHVPPNEHLYFISERTFLTILETSHLIKLE